MDPASRQRILVLGAGGYIGKRVVAALACSEWATPIAALHKAALQEAVPVATLRFDARDRTALGQALRGVDGVVNCIAGTAQTIVSSAGGLVEACSAMVPAPRVVNLSSMMVYGTATGRVQETSPLRGDWNGYSAAKLEAEALLRGYPNVVHLRPGIVYGPGSPIWSVSIAHWLRSGRLGDLGAAGSGYCNLVHVGDVVAAVLRALRMRGIEGQAFNLSCPSPPSWNEYFREFAQALHARYVAISRTRLSLELYLLAPPLKLAEYLMRVVPIARPLPAPIRPWLLRLCAHPLRLDVERSEQTLGMRWIPLSAGIRQTAHWILSGAETPIA